MSRFPVEPAEGSRVPVGYGVGRKGFCERTRRNAACGQKVSAMTRIELQDTLLHLRHESAEAMVIFHGRILRPLCTGKGRVNV
jgi:hypothetical protein